MPQLGAKLQIGEALVLGSERHEPRGFPAQAPSGCGWSAAGGRRPLPNGPGRFVSQHRKSPAGLRPPGRITQRLL